MPSTPYNRAGPGQPIPSYDDWTLQHRGTMAPWGVYERNGETASGFAWPAMVTSPLEAANRFFSPGGGFENLPNPQSEADLLEIMLSGYGGNALSGTVKGAASAKAANALATDVGMFAGQKAATADLNALARAEKLATEGAGRDAIWNETGWFQGPDSKWRFEIDDSGAKLSDWNWNRANDTAGITQESSIGGGLEHPYLWDAYPDIADADMRLMKTLDDGSGAWSRDSRTAYVRGRTEPEARSVGLHEVQHAIQGDEGFARGGNRRIFTPEEIAAERARIGAVPEDNTGWSSVGTGAGDAPDTDVAHGLYKRLAGEVEARNVQTRMNMSADERRATPPWETQDVPYEDQIVRLLSDTGRPNPIGSAIASGAEQPKLVRMYHGTSDDAARSIMDQGFDSKPFMSDREQNALQYGETALPLDVSKSALKIDADLPGGRLLTPSEANGYFSNPNEWTIDNYLGQGRYSFGVDDPNTVFATNGNTLFTDTRPSLMGSAIASSAEQGTPIRAYHGTRFASEPLDTYPVTDGMASAGDAKKRLWASSDADVASSYAEPIGSDLYWNELYPSHTGHTPPPRSGGVFPVEMNFANPLEVDAAGAGFQSVPWEGQIYSADELAYLAQAMGHDGLILKSLQDHMYDQNHAPSTVYAALKRGTVRSPLTGETLFSDTGRPSLLGSAVAGQNQSLIERFPDFGNVPSYAGNKRRIPGDAMNLEAQRKSSGELAYFMRPEGSNGPVGFVNLSEHPIGLEVNSVGVVPEARGNGYANTAYDMIEADTGQQIKPSGFLTQDGYNLWSKRSPGSVDYHRNIPGEPSDWFYSPKKLTDMRDKALGGGPQSASFADKLQSVLDTIPENARTPEYLSTIFSDQRPSLMGSALASEQGKEDWINYLLRP